ncbi:LysR family transcriptional regulator [Pseudomonas sp. MWU12-2037]|uniref:LysR family transcriptional regulator n=1 Tax=Pseudomonas sp. MWU12-2037 TaxID=2928690 RepID=UPI00200FB738|nr:LysR family transcriptional regulator [Pseudomonas sp. MWU12-2037]
MKLTNIDVDLLRALVCVSNTHGFTKAAEKLFRTQSAISLQIKKLEQLTHQKLLERGKEIRLTPAGEKVYHYALQILKLNDELIHTLIHHGPADTTLSIGLPEHHDPELLSHLMDERCFSTTKTCPLFIGDSCANLCRMLDHNQLDMAFILHTELADAIEIKRAPLSWVSALDSSLPRSTTLPLAVPAPGSLIRQLAQKTLRDHARDSTVVCSSNDFMPLRIAIATDQAIGIMPSHAVPEGLSIVKEDCLPRLPETKLFIKLSASLHETQKKIVAELIASLCQP